MTHASEKEHTMTRSKRVPVGCADELDTQIEQLAVSKPRRVATSLGGSTKGATTTDFVSITGSKSKQKVLVNGKDQIRPASVPKL
jgi:hypothetical protein